MEEIKYKDLTEQGWTGMEQLLDQHKPERKNRALWWFIPLGLSVALIAWFILYDGSAEKTAPTEVAHVDDSSTGEIRVDETAPYERMSDIPQQKDVSGKAATDVQVFSVSTARSKNSPSSTSVVTSNERGEMVWTASPSTRSEISFNNSTKNNSEGIYEDEILRKPESAFLQSSNGHLVEADNIELKSIDNEHVKPMDVLALLDVKPLSYSNVLAKNEIAVLRPSFSKIDLLAGVSLIQSLTSSQRAVGVEFGMNVSLVKRINLITKIGVNRSFYNEKLEGDQTTNAVPSPRVGIEFDGSFVDPTFGLGVGYLPSDRIMVYTGLRGHFLNSRSAIENLNPSEDRAVDLSYLKDNGIDFDQSDQEYRIRLLDHFSLDSGVQFNLGSSFYSQVGAEYRIKKVSDALDNLRIQGYLTAGLRF